MKYWQHCFPLFPIIGQMTETLVLFKSEDDICTWNTNQEQESDLVFSLPFQTRGPYGPGNKIFAYFTHEPTEIEKIGLFNILSK